MKHLTDSQIYPFRFQRPQRSGKYLSTLNENDEFYAINLVNGASFGPYVLHAGDFCVVFQDAAYLIRKQARENTSQLFKFESKQQVLLLKQFPDAPLFFSACPLGLTVAMPGVVYFLTAENATALTQFVLAGGTAQSTDTFFAKLDNSQHLPQQITYAKLSDSGLLLLADNDRYVFLYLPPSLYLHLPSELRSLAASQVLPPRILYHGQTPTQTPVLGVAFSEATYEAVLNTRDLCVCFSLHPSLDSIGGPSSLTGESNSAGPGSIAAPTPSSATGTAGAIDDNLDPWNDFDAKDSHVYAFLPNLEDTILGQIGYELLADVLMQQHKDSMLLWLAVEIIKFLEAYEAKSLSNDEIIKKGKDFMRDCIACQSTYNFTIQETELLEIQNCELIYQILEAILGRLLAVLQQRYYRHNVLSTSRYYGRFIQSMRDRLVMNSRIKSIFADENSSETISVFYRNLVIRCNNGALKTVFFDSGLINHQLVFPTNNRSSLNIPAMVSSGSPSASPSTPSSSVVISNPFGLDDMVVYENLLILIQKNWFHAWNMASIGIRSYNYPIVSTNVMKSEPVQSFVYEDTIYSICETRNKENQWIHTNIALRKIQDKLKKFRSVISDTGQEVKPHDEVQAAVRAFGTPVGHVHLDKKSLSVLKKSKQRVAVEYGKFHDITPACLYSDARHGTIRALDCTIEFTKMFGFTKEEFLEKHFRFLFGPMKLIHEYTTWIRDLRRNQVSAREFIFYNKKGTPMTAITLCLPFIKPENGHPFATVCYFFDLSDMECHISAWSPAQVAIWIYNDSLIHKYASIFCLNGISGQILLTISPADLLNLGFSKDLVQYFLDKIREERTKESYAGLPVYSPSTYIKKIRHRSIQGKFTCTVQVILDHLERLIVQYYDQTENFYHSIAPSPIVLGSKNRRDRSLQPPVAVIGTEYCLYARYFVFAFVSYQTQRKQSSFDNNYWDNWDGTGVVEQDFMDSFYDVQPISHDTYSSNSSMLSQEDPDKQERDYQEELHTVERAHGSHNTNAASRTLPSPPHSFVTSNPRAESPPPRPESPPLRPHSPAPVLGSARVIKLDSLDILPNDPSTKQYFDFEYPVNSSCDIPPEQRPVFSPDVKKREFEKEKSREERKKEKALERQRQQQEREKEKEREREEKERQEKEKITIVTKLLATVGGGGFNLEPTVMRVYRLDSFFHQYIPHASDLESTFYHWVCYGQYSHTEIFETSIITASVLSNRVLCFFLSADKSFIFENFYYLKKNESVFLLDKEIKTVVLQSVNYCKFQMSPLFPGKLRNLKNITNVNNFLCQLDRMVLQKVMANVNIFYKGESEVTYADVQTITKCSDPLFKEFVKVMDVENDYQLVGEPNIVSKLHVTPVSFVELENFALVIFHNSSKPFDLLKFDCNNQKIICLVTPFRHTPMRLTSSGGEASFSPTNSGGGVFGSSSGSSHSPQIIASRSDGTTPNNTNAPVTNTNSPPTTTKQLYKITLMFHLTLSQSSPTEQADIANRLRSLQYHFIESDNIGYHKESLRDVIMLMIQNLAVSLINHRFMIHEQFRAMVESRIHAVALAFGVGKGVGQKTASKHVAELSAKDNAFLAYEAHVAALSNAGSRVGSGDVLASGFVGSSAMSDGGMSERSDREALKKKERSRGISFVNRKKSASSVSHELTSSSPTLTQQQHDAMLLVAHRTWALDEKGFEAHCLALKEKELCNLYALFQKLKRYRSMSSWRDRRELGKEIYEAHIQRNPTVPVFGDAVKGGLMEEIAAKISTYELNAKFARFVKEEEKNPDVHCVYTSEFFVPIEIEIEAYLRKEQLPKYLKAINYPASTLSSPVSPGSLGNSSTVSSPVGSLPSSPSNSSPHISMTPDRSSGSGKSKLFSPRSAKELKDKDKDKDKEGTLMKVSSLSMKEPLVSLDLSPLTGTGGSDVLEKGFNSTSGGNLNITPPTSSRDRKSSKSVRREKDSIDQSNKLPRALAQAASTDGNEKANIVSNATNSNDSAANATSTSRELVTVRASIDQDRNLLSGLKKSKSKEKDVNFARDVETVVGVGSGGTSGSSKKGRERSPDGSQTSSITSSGKKSRDRERSPDASQASSINSSGKKSRERERSPSDSANSGPDERFESGHSPVSATETKLSLFEQLKMKKSKSRDKVLTSPDSPRRRDSSIVLHGRDKVMERSMTHDGRTSTRESIDSASSAVVKTDSGGFRDSPPLTPQQQPGTKHTSILETVQRISPRGGERDREGRMDSARGERGGSVEPEGPRSARGETRSPRKSMSRDDIRAGITIEGMPSNAVVNSNASSHSPGTRDQSTVQRTQSQYPSRSPRQLTEFEHNVKERKDRELRTVASVSDGAVNRQYVEFKSDADLSTYIPTSITPTGLVNSSAGLTSTSHVGTPYQQSPTSSAVGTPTTTPLKDSNRSRRNSVSSNDGTSTPITIEEPGLASSGSIAKSQSRSRKFSLSLTLDSHNLPVIVRDTSPRRSARDKPGDRSDRDGGEMSVYQTLEASAGSFRKSSANKKSDSPKRRPESLHTEPPISGLSLLLGHMPPRSNTSSAGELDEAVQSGTGTPRKGSKSQQRDSGHRRTSSTDTPGLLHHESAPKLLQTKKKRSISPVTKDALLGYPSSGETDPEHDSDEDSLGEDEIPFTAPNRLSHSLTSAVTSKRVQPHEARTPLGRTQQHLTAAGVGGASISRGQTPEGSPDRSPHHVQFADEVEIKGLGTPRAINFATATTTITTHATTNTNTNTNTTDSNVASQAEPDDRDSDRGIERERSRGSSTGERGRKKYKSRANSADPRSETVRHAEASRSSSRSPPISSGSEDGQGSSQLSPVPSAHHSPTHGPDSKSSSASTTPLHSPSPMSISANASPLTSVAGSSSSSLGSGTINNSTIVNSTGDKHAREKERVMEQSQGALTPTNSSGRSGRSISISLRKHKRHSDHMRKQISDEDVDEHQRVEHRHQILPKEQPQGEEPKK